MGIIRLVPSLVDERGQIIDLLENENLNAVTIVTFNRGAIRGNHCHKLTFQWNYLMSGMIRLVTQKVGHPIVETIMRLGDFALTEPNERHAFMAIEDSALMVFTRGPRGGKEYESDTYRLEIPLVQNVGAGDWLA